MTIYDRIRSTHNYLLGKKTSGRSFRCVIEITNACNLKCTMCLRNIMNRPIENMNEQLFEKIISENYKSFEMVSLNGFGEPLLHPQLSEYIQCCKKYGVSVGISTNATRLTEEKSLQLLETPPDIIILAIDGASAPTYEKVRVGAQFDIVMNNVKHYLNLRKKMKKFDSFVILQCIAMTETKEEISRFKENFRGFAYDAIRIRQLTYSGNERSDANYQNTVSSCYWIWHEPMILSNGTLVPCCQDVNGDLALGNLKETPLEQLWNKGNIEKIRQQHGKGNRSSIALCKSCNMYQPNLLFSCGAALCTTMMINRILPRIETIISNVRYK